MKKYYFILAAAALGFASCSNDETIESAALSESNEISFRPLMTGMTRGVDVNQTWLQGAGNGFKVRATLTTGGAQYFPETQFTYSADTYSSTTKYYWPATDALDFFAWAASGSDVTHTDNTYAFTVTPNATAASQSDLVVACTKNKTKTGDYLSSDPYNASPASTDRKYGADGVPLNFRHAGTKVTITLTNSNTTGFDFVIRDASICNVKNSGVFTFSPATATDGKDATTLTIGEWADVTDPATITTSYSQNITSLNTLAQDWILVPQTFTYETTYSGSNVNDPFNGPCIKVNLKIKNHGSNIYIVGADDDPNDANDNEGYETAMWPLSAPASGWLPGKKYTYTVDLAGGGYYPANTAAGTGTALDPILDGAEIKFVTVTVDDWPAGDATGVYTTGL